MTVLFKFKTRASEQARASVARHIEQHFGVNFAPMFPGSEGTELADVFAVDVPAQQTKKLVDELSGLQPIEYAEVPPDRRLASAL